MPALKILSHCPLGALTQRKKGLRNAANISKTRVFSDKEMTMIIAISGRRVKSQIDVKREGDADVD